MMQPGMHRTGIYQMSKCHLVNTAQPLIIRMRNDLQDQRMINGNKTIYRIVDDFSDSVPLLCLLLKGLKR